MPIRISLMLVTVVVASGCKPDPGSDNIQKSVVTTQPGASPSLSSSSISFVGPDRLIPVGRIPVDVMVITAPPRANELAERLQQAARNNPRWWLDHVKSAEPGKPLRYDPRMGLTESEYDEFRALSKQLSTQKQAEATLTVTAKGNEVYSLDGGDALADLNGIEIDLRNDLVRSPFGIAKQRSNINAPETTALGAWTGLEWKLEDPASSGTAGTIAKLAFGRLKPSGRGVLYYDVKKVSTQEQKRITVILNYDLPAAQ